jgi:serine/threonine protein kinase
VTTDPFGLIGQVLDGQFRVDRYVGEGGFSIVYRGQHLGLDEPIAVKCLKLPGALGSALVESFVRRFRDESRLHYKLSQGNLHIVRSIASGTTMAPTTGALVPYMVLEWLDGRSLGADFDERRRQGLRGRTIEEVVRLLDAGVQAIAYAHAQGVVHRDLNPGNLFIASTREGAIMKVLDFGVAKIVNDHALALGPRAQTIGHVRIFSPAYGAPEQFDDRIGNVGPWTDVFALALIVLEALTDRTVREGESLGEFAVQALDESRVLSPQAVGARVGPGVDAVLTRALSRKPQDRPGDAGEFWGMLKHALAKDTGASRPDASEARASLPSGGVFGDLPTRISSSAVRPSGSVPDASANTPRPPAASVTGEPPPGSTTPSQPPAGFGKTVRLGHGGTLALPPPGAGPTSQESGVTNTNPGSLQPGKGSTLWMSPEARASGRMSEPSSPGMPPPAHATGEGMIAGSAAAGAAFGGGAQGRPTTAAGLGQPLPPTQGMEAFPDKRGLPTTPPTDVHAYAGAHARASAPSYEPTYEPEGAAQPYAPYGAQSSLPPASPFDAPTRVPSNVGAPTLPATAYDPSGGRRTSAAPPSEPVDLPKSRAPLFVGLALGALVVLGAGFFGVRALLRSRAPDPIAAVDADAPPNADAAPLATTEPLPAPAATPVEPSGGDVQPSSSDAGLAGAGPGDAGAATASGTAPHGSHPPQSGANPGTPSGAGGVREPRTDPRPSGQGGKPAFSTYPLPTTPQPDANNKSFRPQAARAALDAVAPTLASCKRAGGVTGSGHVWVTFAPSGDATLAVVDQPPFAGTIEGGCIAEKLRAAKMPAFEGNPGTVSYSFAIR